MCGHMCNMPMQFYALISADNGATLVGGRLAGEEVAPVLQRTVQLMTLPPFARPPHSSFR